MTDIELITKVLKSKKPSDIFPNDDWKKDYIQYSKLIHTDICKLPNANDAMAKINDYKDLIENGKTFTDETGNFKVFEKELNMLLLIIIEIYYENHLIILNFLNLKKIKHH